MLVNDIKMKSATPTKLKNALEADYKKNKKSMVELTINKTNISKQILK